MNREWNTFRRWNNLRLPRRILVYFLPGSTKASIWHQHYISSAVLSWFPHVVFFIQQQRCSVIFAQTPTVCQCIAELVSLYCLVCGAGCKLCACDCVCVCFNFSHCDNSMFLRLYGFHALLTVLKVSTKELLRYLLRHGTVSVNKISMRAASLVCSRDYCALSIRLSIA